MADYIERNAAVSRFEQLKEQADTMRDKLYLDGVLAVIDALPAANVREDVRGKWIFPVFDDSDENDPRCKCSVCGSIETPLARHNFCPNCGARMTGGGEL